MASARAAMMTRWRVVISALVDEGAGQWAGQTCTGRLMMLTAPAEQKSWSIANLGRTMPCRFLCTGEGSQEDIGERKKKKKKSRKKKPLPLPSTPEEAGSTKNMEDEGSNENRDSPVSELNKQFRSEIKRLRGMTRMQKHEFKPTPSPLDPYLDVWRQFRGWIGTTILKSAIDRDFDAADFVEGSRDAFRQLMGSMFNPDEVDLFSKMVSPRVLYTVLVTRKEYDADGLSVKLEVEEIYDAKVDEVFVTRGENLTDTSTAIPNLVGDLGSPDLDDGEDGDECNSSISALVSKLSRMDGTMYQGNWLVVAVRFRCRLRCHLTNDDGHIVSDTADESDQVIKFGRGPLPHISELPVENLDHCPWKVVDMT